MRFLRTFAFFVVLGTLAGALEGLILGSRYMSIQTIDFATENLGQGPPIALVGALRGALLGLSMGILTGLVIGWLVRRTTQPVILIVTAAAVAAVPLFIVAFSIFANPIVIPSLQITLIVTMLVNGGLGFLYHLRLKAAG